jgi:hypothetical protein
MLRRSPIPVSLAAALVLLVALESRAHTLVAQGANACISPVCTDTHLEGHFATGVPGVDSDSFYMNTLADSDSGALSIDAGLSWFEGATRPQPGLNLINASISENLVMTRLAPGPVTARATLDFAPVAQILGPGHSAVTVHANLTLYGGCQVSAQQTFSIIGAGDLEVTGSGPCAETDGSTLVVSATWDDALPTSPQLAASISSEYLTIQKGSVTSVQTAAALTFELSNATADWDTPTFLTEAPEPEADALALVALGAIAAVGARRRAPR